MDTELDAFFAMGPWYGFKPACAQQHLYCHCS